MMGVARMRGLAGLVVDGAIRDCSVIRQEGFPCYARAVTHRGPIKNGPGELNVPVSIDGCVVAPGAIVAGDDDGVLFITPDLSDSVATAPPQTLQTSQKALA